MRYPHLRFSPYPGVFSIGIRHLPGAGTLGRGAPRSVAGLHARFAGRCAWPAAQALLSNKGLDERGSTKGGNNNEG